MATEAFQLLDNVNKLPADINADDIIFISADQDNSTGTTYPSLKLIMDYIDLDSTDATPSITAVVEGKASISADYYPIAYQFCPFASKNLRQRREIIMQPTMFWPDAGVDNIIFVAGKGTVAQVSNTPALLSPTWRVVLHINDPNSSFTSLDLSVYGERFSVV